MSPSDRDDADRHIMPGPPWVRPNRSRDDAYRGDEDDVAEPANLDRTFRPVPNRARPQYRDVEDGYEYPEPRLNRPDGRRHERPLPTLEPVVMPPPPLEKTRLPGRGIVIKLGVAVAVAACAALAMMNAVQIPGIAAAVGNGSQSSANPVFEGLTEIASAQAKALPTPAPPPSVDAFVAATASPDPAAAVQPMAAPRQTSRETAVREASLGDAPLRQVPDNRPSLGEWAPRPDTAARIPTAPEERRAAAPMPREEIASLLKRGRALMAAGDIASARLILTRLAEAGSVDACLTLAGTFDASVLAEMHVVGVQPDPAKARSWYLKAAEQGSPEAKRRLQQSSVR